MPSEYRSIKLEFNETAELADLHGVEYDLHVVAELLDEVKKQVGLNSHESLITEALFNSALIRYFRCFSKSPRRGLSSKDIESASEELYSRFVFFQNLRSKFVAHSVNLFEYAWVTAQLQILDGVSQPIKGLGHAGRRRILGVSEASNLAQLVDETINLTKEKILRLQPEVLAFIQKFPVDDLQAREPRPAQFDSGGVGSVRTQTVLRESS
jgi:hypothetical protein